MSAPIDVVFAVWILWSLLFSLGLCSAAARPIPHPEPLPIGPTAIVQVIRQRCPALNCAFVSLSLFAFLLVGCATRRDYPGPVHGLTFNGTVQSIDLKEHRLAVAPLKPGEPVVFLWEDSTRFWKNGDPIRPESLEPTWPVRVHYHTTSGQATAHHVYVDLTYPVLH